MARLYANENFPLLVVQELRKLGHDVLTIQETGRGNQAMPDKDVLRFALEDKRALITLNRKDFIQLHKGSGQHEGIIVCTFDADFVSQAKRIHEMLSAYDSLTGKLIRVNRDTI